MLGTDLFKDKPKAQDWATNPESVRRMNVTVTTNEPRATCTCSNFLTIASCCSEFRTGQKRLAFKGPTGTGSHTTVGVLHTA